MYVDGSIDFEGPARLPRSNVTTRIKPRKIHTSRATAEDPIVLSSGEDTSVVVKPAKKSKSKSAASKATSLKGKGKSRYIPIDDSSDDDAGPTTEGDITPLADVDDVSPTTADAVLPVNTDAAKSLPTTQGLKNEDDYQVPGPSGKRKANAIVPSQNSKKPALQSRKPDPHGKCARSFLTQLFTNLHIS